jgi:nucleoid DNA-binding protein
MIGKFIQTYFAVDDNVMDKKLLKLVNEKTFTSKKNVKQIINEIVETVGERFYQGDL